MTLIELLVVIVALGAMASVVGLTWRAGLGAPPDPGGDEGVAEVLALRAQALTAGEAVTRTVRIGGTALVVTALPDGRVVGAERLGFDPLTGRLARTDGPEVDSGAATPGAAAGETGAAAEAVERPGTAAGVAEALGTDGDDVGGGMGHTRNERR